MLYLSSCLFCCDRRPELFGLFCPSPVRDSKISSRVCVSLWTTATIPRLFVRIAAFHKELQLLLAKSWSLRSNAELGFVFSARYYSRSCTSQLNCSNAFEAILYVGEFLCCVVIHKAVLARIPRSYHSCQIASSTTVVHVLVLSYGDGSGVCPQP